MTGGGLSEVVSEARRSGIYYDLTDAIADALGASGWWRHTTVGHLSEAVAESVLAAGLAARANATQQAGEALRAGIYRHRKGGLYLLLGPGHDSNEDGREVVVYVPLYTDPAKTGPRLAVRTRDEFEERFEYVGAHYTAALAAPARDADPG